MLLPELPAPTPKSREEKRFARADRDDDGIVSPAEFVAARRRNFDKLDANGDGRLSFEEYAAEGFRKFAAADVNGDGRLNAAEFATTARPPASRTARTTNKGSDCACG
jgi:Ca2+-binding EF-hand superfamily protein